MSRSTVNPDVYGEKTIVCDLKTIDFPINSDLTIVKAVNGETELRYRMKYDGETHPFFDIYKFLLKNKGIKYQAYLNSVLMEEWDCPYDVDYRITEISQYEEYYIAENLTIIIYNGDYANRD